MVQICIIFLYRSVKFGFATRIQTNRSSNRVQCCIILESNLLILYLIEYLQLSAYANFTSYFAKNDGRFPVIIISSLLVSTRRTGRCTLQLSICLNFGLELLNMFNCVLFFFTCKQRSLLAKEL